ncbi:Rv3654c family TadE-like protein [Nocardia goodfellowii]|uniref:Secretion/DNA translocation related TadE-like protein n=1 Tax=Nocardia goodfellowii TaxID=882446 RepID=A0ABS4Q859_9NOCA|nr:Rv3654c family TadE-like protein [Nocardia goodfellowii]MBP2187874.1 secretion/DNA translocation related TadE-like protein [Nocardia goodfellowii]
MSKDAETVCGPTPLEHTDTMIVRFDGLRRPWVPNTVATCFAFIGEQLDRADLAGIDADSGGLNGPPRRRLVIEAGDERGGATVLACLALAGLIAVTLLISQVGAAVVARHRVQAAADLAALAGAGALGEGVEAGCAAAGDIARLMRARVRTCSVSQWDVTVTAERNVPMGLFGARVVSAIARAGPVEDEL